MLRKVLPADYKKFIDVFLYRRNEQFLLHFVVITDQLAYTNNMHARISDSYAANNKIDDRSLFFPGYLVIKNDLNEVDDPYHQRSRLIYHDFILSLPTEPVALLRLILAMDNALHSLLMHDNKKRNTLGKVFYNDKIPDLSKQQDLIYNAFILRKADAPEATVHLSRHVASWLVTALKNDASNEHAKLVSNLDELLELGGSSICRAIRNQLYPDTQLKEYLDTSRREDYLYSDMLNPKVNHATVSRAIVERIALKLSEKPNIPVTSVQIAQDAVFRLWNTATNFFYRRPKELSRPVVKPDDDTDPISNDIKQWFERFIHLRNQYWRLNIATLLALPAPDEGLYGINYTEIELLNQSTIRLNKDGRMELSYFDTRSFKKNYTPGGCAYPDLEEEVRAACGVLGLEFLPNQNFYIVNPEFTDKSTQDLLNQGYQYSVEYLKALMRASHRFKLFSSTVLSTDLQSNIIFRAARAELAKSKTSPTIEIDLQDVISMRQRKIRKW